MKFYFLAQFFTLIGLFLHSAAYSAPIISFQHEEDTAGVLKVENINYPVQDLTDYLGANSELLDAVEFKISALGPFKIARINVIYNHLGDLLGIFVNHNIQEDRPLGMIINSDTSNSLKNSKNLLEKLASTEKITAFRFNDPTQDLTYPPVQIDLHRKMLIPFYIDQSGITGKEGVIERYQFAKEESTGAMDFFKNFEIPALIDGVLYNPKDAGNFTWAVGMHKLGFSYLETKMGSEVNAFFNTREQNDDDAGIILMGDSKKDQAAIKAGFYSYFSTQVRDLESYQQMLMDEYIPNNPNLLPILTSENIEFEAFWLKWVALNWKTFKSPMHDWSMSTLLTFSWATKYMAIQDCDEAIKQLLKLDHVPLATLYIAIDFIFDRYDSIQDPDVSLRYLISRPEANRELLESLKQKLIETLDQVYQSQILIDLIDQKLAALPPEIQDLTIRL